MRNKREFEILIAFDVDNTLVTENRKPIYENIDLLIKVSKFADVVVWSGGGEDYAEQWVRRLGIDQYVWACFDKNLKVAGDLAVDIAIDDQHVKLGKVNIQHYEFEPLPNRKVL